MLVLKIHAHIERESDLDEVNDNVGAGEVYVEPGQGADINAHSTIMMSNG